MAVILGIWRVIPSRVHQWKRKARCMDPQFLWSTKVAVSRKWWDIPSFFLFTSRFLKSFWGTCYCYLWDLIPSGFERHIYFFGGIFPRKCWTSIFAWKKKRFRGCFPRCSKDPHLLTAWPPRSVRLPTKRHKKKHGAVYECFTHGRNQGSEDGRAAGFCFSAPVFWKHLEGWDTWMSRTGS